MFLTILRYHVREGHLQYFMKLRSDLLGEDDETREDHMEQLQAEKSNSARNDSISCDLGLSYLLLQSIFTGKKNHQTLQVYLYCI